MTREELVGNVDVWLRAARAQAGGASRLVLGGQPTGDHLAEVLFEDRLADDGLAGRLVNRLEAAGFGAISDRQRKQRVAKLDGEIAKATAGLKEARRQEAFDRVEAEFAHDTAALYRRRGPAVVQPSHLHPQPADSPEGGGEGGPEGKGAAGAAGSRSRLDRAEAGRRGRRVNVCRACRCDFTGVTLFDSHRVGIHAYTYSEGLKMEPIREDGRRCLDEAEMGVRGWAVNGRGRWFDPHSAVRVAQIESVNVIGPSRRAA